MGLWTGGQSAVDLTRDCMAVDCDVSCCNLVESTCRYLHTS
jgi:hypothetical protein